MKTKTFAIILSLILTAVCFAGCGSGNSGAALPANAEEARLLSEISGKITETGEIGEQGSNVKYSLYSDGTLLIQGKGRIKDYDEKPTDPAVSPLYGKSVTSVIILDGITKIGMNALPKQELTRAYVPGSVQEMSRAFQGAHNLKEVVLAEGITVISDRTFSLCSGLESVVIPDTVKVIEERAFTYCESLHEITIPPSVTEIDRDAFDACFSFEKIYVAAGSCAEEYAKTKFKPEKIVYTNKTES